MFDLKQNVVQCLFFFRNEFLPPPHFPKKKEDSSNQFHSRHNLCLHCNKNPNFDVFTSKQRKKHKKCQECNNEK